MPNITNPVSISDLLCFKHVSLDFNILYQSYREYENSKYSNKTNQIIKSYGVNTYQGLYRYLIINLEIIMKIEYQLYLILLNLIIL